MIPEFALAREQFTEDVLILSLSHSNYPFIFLLSKAYLESTPNEFPIPLLTSHSFIWMSNHVRNCRPAYLWVLLNLCIKRLPSANLIWIFVVGTESSIRTTALSMDLSSSSGDEGVLTISGVRLRRKNWRVRTQVWILKTWKSEDSGKITDIHSWLSSFPACDLGFLWVSHNSSNFFHYTKIILHPRILI